MLSPYFISICFCYVNLALEEDTLITGLEVVYCLRIEAAEQSH